MEELKQILTSAGIFASEFAQLVKVHRLTATRWVNGHPIRQELQRHAVIKMAELIRSGTEKGVFPISKEFTYAERMPEIRRRLRSL